MKQRFSALLLFFSFLQFSGLHTGPTQSRMHAAVFGKDTEKKKYTAIIFDMDGTIIDTDHIWEETTRIMLARRDIRLDDATLNDFLERMTGVAMRTTCEVMQKEFGFKENIEALIEEKKATATQLYESVKLIEGFAAFHDKVRKRNLKIGLATNADDATLAATARNIELEYYFGTHIYNISSVERGKPHPDIYQHAAQQLGEEPCCCIAIEDSISGIRSARAAGIFCIGLDRFGDARQVSEADLIVQSFDEIDLDSLL